jgi:hypothetical protein
LRDDAPSRPEHKALFLYPSFVIVLYGGTYKEEKCLDTNKIVFFFSKIITKELFDV